MLLKKAIAATCVLALMAASAFGGYWICSRQFEEIITLSYVNDATWHLNFLEALNQNKLDEAKTNHRRLLDQDIEILARTLEGRPELNGAGMHLLLDHITT